MRTVTLRALSLMSLALPISAAAEVDGIVVCSPAGTEVTQLGRLVGSEWAIDALQQAGMNVSLFPLMWAEAPTAVAAGIGDGFAFHDRDIYLSDPDMQIGVSGLGMDRMTQGMACRMVVEDAACAHIQNADWTVSCLSPNAVQDADTGGESF